MREILFRGKNRADVWLYGDLQQRGNAIDTDGIDLGGDTFIEPHEYGDEVYSPDYYAVIPDTVGQFTGLSDKNGVKIFEGDIVQWERDEGYTVGEVVYSQEHCGFVVRVRWFSILKQEWRTFETEVGGGLDVIIGNIHDNPELLGT